MGIKGLLQSLRPVEKPINIANYKGKSVAIDGHCILHRGCFGAATNLALNRPTESHIDHFMHYVGLFEYHGVTPIVVFDGLPLPLKKITNDDRRRLRQTALKEGLALYEQGRIVEAEKYFQQSVHISEETIKVIIRKLIAKKVQCIVAPNEADAQLAHLAKTGKVDAIVTEDSDLLAFGCSKCIYKIDRYGNGVEISLDQVLHNQASIFYNFDPETIRHICILSGCDYLPSLKGVGLKTILKRYNNNQSTDLALVYLRYKLRQEFPHDYFEKFYLANLGFLHQWVYDMDEKNYVRLNPLPKECSDQDIMLLGKIPTVQDSSMFRVNKVIPKMKDKDEPFKRATDDVDTMKEDDLRSHLLSPSSSTPASPTSSKSNHTGILTDKSSSQASTISITVANNSNAAFANINDKRQEITAPTRTQRLDAFFKSNGVLPRKRSTTPGKTIRHSVEQDKENLLLTSTSFIRHLKILGLPSEFPAHYLADRQHWITKQNLQRASVSSITKTTKDLIHQIQKGKTAEKTAGNPSCAARKRLFDATENPLSKLSSSTTTGSLKHPKHHKQSY